MIRGSGLVLLTTITLAATGIVGSVSDGVAQSAQDRLSGMTQISAQAQQKKGGNVGQHNIQRNVGQRNIQRNVGQRKIQRNVDQRKNQRNVGQRKIDQAGRKLRAASIRGASRARIGGRNYSIWRGRHRVRHGGRWRTFVALSTLGAIAIGSSEYYPYAYISAPEPYCEGLTEDGCELRWQEVQTIEGDLIDQCVAYCPWQ